MILLPITHPFTTARLLGLQATVAVLLTLLIKSKLLRVHMAFTGTLLFLAALASFAATTGLMAVVTGGSLAYAMRRRGATGTDT